MIKKSRRGKCHHPGCDEPAPVYCIKHTAAREIWAREHGAVVLNFFDYERDPVSGYLHKKIS